MTGGVTLRGLTAWEEHAEEGCSPEGFWYTLVVAVSS
jgi:hypothetical protein